MAAPIRILLVDDHDLVRAGIASLLRNFAGVEVVAEAGDGQAAIEQVAKLRPDLVLMDIMMPRLNGLEAAARITKEHPGTKVIIVSMNSSEEHALGAMRAGASGFLLKNVSPMELELAVRAVARGEKYLASAVSQHVIAAYVQRVGGGASTLDALTPRQREVLQLIAEGATTKDIAARLGISVKTAEMHRSQLMEALDIHDIAGLVRYAIRMGVISPDR